MNATRKVSDERRQRLRQLNREWHYFPRDGRCEAITKSGEQCRFNGYYDGLSQKVLCAIHDKPL